MANLWNMAASAFAAQGESIILQEIAFVLLLTIAALEPKSSASANSATFACRHFTLYWRPLPVS